MATIPKKPQPEIAPLLTAAQAEAIRARIEVTINAAIPRLLQVNDVYGSPTLRQAMLDELNGATRQITQWLMTFAESNGTSPEGLPSSKAQKVS